MNINKPGWISDHRLISDDAMEVVRHIAVAAIVDRNKRPDDVSDIIGFSLSSIYEWLNRFAVDGYEGLKTRKAPGAPPIITIEMDDWLKTTVLGSTPENFGYETPLWTSDILAELLQQKFGVTAASRTVNQHLKNLNLSYQKPAYHATEQDPNEVERFLNDKFPRIQKLAAKINADIGFEDEAGIDLRERSGKSWGTCGHPPEVGVTGKRGRLNMLSVVTAAGALEYKITEDTITAHGYIEFLEQLIKGRDRPFIFIADRASFHHAKSVVKFVRDHRQKLRIYFLPAYSPQLNPDEHVWEEIKDKRLGRETVRSKSDLKRRLEAVLKSLKENTNRVRSFFCLPQTKYAAS